MLLVPLPVLHKSIVPCVFVHCLNVCNKGTRRCVLAHIRFDGNLVEDRGVVVDVGDCYPDLHALAAGSEQPAIGRSHLEDVEGLLLIVKFTGILR